MLRGAIDAERAELIIMTDGDRQTDKVRDRIVLKLKDSIGKT